MSVGIAVVGYGYWGPNLVRNFAEVPGAHLVAVADLSERSRGIVRRRYPSVRVASDVTELLALDEVQAIIVATPADTHYALCEAALKSGKDVLVTKPMTMTSAESKRLVELARGHERVLMVDHTFVYTGAVRKLRELMDAGRLGKLLYYDSVRVNLGLFQQDANVLWDLAAHDLAILDYVCGKPVRAVSATGMAHVPGKPENMAFLTCFFDDSFIAHIHVNWLSPIKIRRTLIGGDQEMVLYDELEPSEKLKVYDRGIELDDRSDGAYERRVGYRSGDMWAPQLDLTEALKVEAGHFVDCVARRSKPISDGGSGYRVIQVLEAASRSMRERGCLVEIPG